MKREEAQTLINIIRGRMQAFEKMAEEADDLLTQCRLDGSAAEDLEIIELIKNYARNGAR